jgi:hypothetical protein
MLEEPTNERVQSPSMVSQRSSQFQEGSQAKKKKKQQPNFQI